MTAEFADALRLVLRDGTLDGWIGADLTASGIEADDCRELVEWVLGEPDDSWEEIPELNNLVMLAVGIGVRMERTRNDVFLKETSDVQLP